MHYSQVLPQSCRGAVHWLLCNKQPRQSRYMTKCEAVYVCVCVCVCVRQCVRVTAVSIPEPALSSVMYANRRSPALITSRPTCTPTLGRNLIPAPGQAAPSVLPAQTSLDATLPCTAAIWRRTASTEHQS